MLAHRRGLSRRRSPKSQPSRATLAGALRPGTRALGTEPGRAGGAGARHVEVARASSAASRRGAGQPRRDRDSDPRPPAPVAARRGAGAAGQGRGAAADRLVQGARTCDGGEHGAALRDRGHGAADQWQCRGCAGGLRGGCGDRSDRHLPGGNPADQYRRGGGLWRPRADRRRADRRMRAAGGRGRCGWPLVRRLDPQGALSRRGQEGDGAGSGCGRRSPNWRRLA
jgi:hypothetical protein